MDDYALLYDIHVHVNDNGDEFVSYEDDDQLVVQESEKEHSDDN